MRHGALMHEVEDDVAVVIKDIKEGDEVNTVTIEGQEVCTVRAIENISFGHKIAVRDIAKGKAVIKYSRTIGKATQDIAKGAHVHNHNVKSTRWA